MLHEKNNKFEIDLEGQVDNPKPCTLQIEYVNPPTIIMHYSFITLFLVRLKYIVLGIMLGSVMYLSLSLFSNEII